MAPHRNLQRKLLLVKLLQNSRTRRKEMQQKILFLLTVRRMILLEVFFLSALLISSEKTTADRSCRRLPRNKGWFEEVWNTYTAQRFKKTFRVSKATFDFILGRIQHHCDDTDSTSPIASSSSSSSCSL